MLSFIKSQFHPRERVPLKMCINFDLFNSKETLVRQNTVVAWCLSSAEVNHSALRPHQEQRLLLLLEGNRPSTWH
jgi:hypothetical protein